MAKIILIGASGTIGSAVTNRLIQSHTVIRVGHHQGDHTVDLGSKVSIEALFEKTGSCDHVICTAGLSRFAKLEDATDEDFAVSVNHKLMGQVNLVRIAQRHISKNGSITITTGILAREPMPATAPTAMVNAGLEGFVRAAAIDLNNRIRINAVSPIFVTATAKRMGMPARGTMTAEKTAQAYQAAVEGDMTGQVLDVRDFGIVE
jgi:NAD(P)-dependent dehydrogenase (short-subunit alcohol dehydrogenase family)